MKNLPYYSHRVDDPLIIGLLLIFTLIIYFLPTILTRRDRMGMFVVNLLTGWSILGWVGCCIACLIIRSQVSLKEEIKDAIERHLQKD